MATREDEIPVADLQSMLGLLLEMVAEPAAQDVTRVSLGTRERPVDEIRSAEEQPRRLLSGSASERLQRFPPVAGLLGASRVLGSHPGEFADPTSIGSLAKVPLASIGKLLRGGRVSAAHFASPTGPGRNVLDDAVMSASPDELMDFVRQAEHRRNTLFAAIEDTPISAIKDRKVLRDIHGEEYMRLSALRGIVEQAENGIEPALSFVRNYFKGTGYAAGAKSERDALDIIRRRLHEEQKSAFGSMIKGDPFLERGVTNPGENLYRLFGGGQ